ncbi:Microtubule-associated serine/threonine-protein kinase [Trichinella pseudospiralis]
MRGSKGPFLCFLLIPSHFGKISHQGDCGGANIRSGTFCLSHHILGQLVTKRNAGQEIALLLTFTPVLFAIHITFWDNQSTGGMWGGDDNFFTSCSSHYILGHQREECVLGCQLLHILSITSDFGTEIHQQECGAVNVHSCSFCLSHHILGKYVTSWKTPATIACFAHHADPILLLSISRPMENQRENRHSSTSHCSHPQTVLGMSKTVRIHVFTTLWPVGNVKSFQMLCDELELRRCFRPKCYPQQHYSGSFSWSATGDYRNRSAKLMSYTSYMFIANSPSLSTSCCA